MRPPKYYDDQLERIDPKHLKLIKARRIRRAEEKGDLSTYTLQAKETIALQRFSQTIRNLE